MIFLRLITSFEAKLVGRTFTDSFWLPYTLTVTNAVSLYGKYAKAFNGIDPLPVEVTNIPNCSPEGYKRLLFSDTCQTGPHLLV